MNGEHTNCLEIINKSEGNRVIITKENEMDGRSLLPSFCFKFSLLLSLATKCTNNIGMFG